MDKYTRPENIETLSADEIPAIRELAAAYRDEINGIDGDLTAAQMDELEAVLNDIDAIDARATAIETEAAALAERREALRTRATEAPAEEVVEEPAAEVVEEPVVEEPVEVAEPVLASGQKRNTVAAAARKAPAVIIKKEEPVEPLVAITAAANVPEFNSGAPLETPGDIAAAFLARVGTFGGENDPKMKSGLYKMSSNFSRHGVARIKRNAREFEVDRNMGLEEQFAIIAAAADEKRLSGQSLTAAGGWCAPSETIYDLPGYETSAGLIDIPEVTARRGGISFTKGPDFMTIFGDSDAGFIQTETQAEAGTTKPCYALECPPFEEVRLDAIGFCATAPLLTNAAYPELVSRVLNLLMIGHARRKSQSTINRILASIGTTGTNQVTFAPVGGAGNQSGISDALAAAELRANQIRQSLAMDPKATVEGLAPYWARGVFRTELSRRNGLDNALRISDADIDGFFAERGIRFQYVYDWQMLGTGNLGTPGGTALWTAWPTTLEFAMWPAGAFVRLVNDVISLDAVYDHELLTGNEYTAAFVEEGIAVANTRGYGLRTIVALNPEGTSGAQAIGAGAGVNYAA